MHARKLSACERTRNPGKANERASQSEPERERARTSTTTRARNIERERKRESGERNRACERGRETGQGIARQ